MQSRPHAEAEPSSNKDDSGKATWSSTITSINPWNKTKDKTATEGTDAAKLQPKPLNQADDHLTTPLYGQSFRNYPEGCPTLPVRWFHAVDAPKRNGQQTVGTSASAGNKDKAPAKPKKFAPFSRSDSARIEKEYQTLLEAEEDNRTQKHHSDGPRSKQPNAPKLYDGIPALRNSSPVPVNEDFLFDVTVPNRELYPVYWEGPVYEVRRGTWFFQDGSSLRPCEENLAAQIEEGYLKLKPWKEQEVCEATSGSTSHGSSSINDKSLTDISKPATQEVADGKAAETASKPHKVRSHRLFGAYMASTVTYEDRNTAWLTSDGVLSWVTNSVYERFAGGGYMSGVKLLRGYSEQLKAKEKEKENEAEARSKATKDDSGLANKEVTDDRTEEANRNDTSRQKFIQRKLSNIISDEERRAPKTEEQVQKLNEAEMRNDYLTQSGESQSRDIQHLILVTHGIGQRLSLRMQSVNFIHDVNVLRKTLKAVYANSADLRSVNKDEGGGPGNCRVQVLPVCWRHKLDFPKQRSKKPEADLGDLSPEDRYPSLEDITVDGVAFARSLISDLALDVLLYQSSYRQEIAKIVTDESNRIVNLFKKRNPEFQGKIHVVGHSLGSAILFDILCKQNRHHQHNEDRMTGLRFWPSTSQNQEPALPRSEKTFQFDVEDLYCLGSPIGLFQMLNGRTIAARPSKGAKHNRGLNSIESEDLTPNVSSPDVNQLFNIFYPSDPISYRLEPLIAPALSKLKPHQMPYTKKGIFAAVRPQGLTDIGSMVGQSFSGFWSSLSTGISSNFISPSLRLNSDEARQVENNVSDTSSMAAKKNNISHSQGLLSDKSPKQDSHETGSSSLLPPASAISDAELETLYSQFYMYGQQYTAEGDEEQEENIGEDSGSRKLRIAQRKVWNLNRNGRVDFSIQEGALDFNPISTIASHIGYWSDEDVNHFILTQMLSQREKQQK